MPDECDFGQVWLLNDFDGAATVPFSIVNIYHVTTACRPPGGGAFGAYAYFGFHSTCTYENGAETWGTLRMESVPLPPRSKVILQYGSYFRSERGGPSLCELGELDLQVGVTTLPPRAARA